MDDFTEVLVEATGAVIRVPAHFIGDPVLGRGIEKTTRQRVLDGEVDVADLVEVPTVRSRVAEIESYAQSAGIDLSGCSNNEERIAIIDSALAAAPLPNPGVQPEEGVETVPEPPQLVEPDEVQVAGPGGTPATPSTDGTEPSDETPHAGDKE